jgi:hypothetical protein
MQLAYGPISATFILYVEDVRRKSGDSRSEKKGGVFHDSEEQEFYWEEMN